MWQRDTAWCAGLSREPLAADHDAITGIDSPGT
jgi:hypothetical protein